MSNQEKYTESIAQIENVTSLRQKDFQLISTTLHHVDFKSDDLVDATEKLKGDDISVYISDLIDTIISKGDKREFNFPSNNSQVIAATHKLIRDNSLHYSLAEEISKRLLIKEKKVQEDREKKNLKNELRKGSLIQALIKRYDKYEYLLLKIEHDSYFDLESLMRHYGLAEKKSVIKSCLIRFDDNNFVDSVFLTDTNSKISTYWWDSFLELKKERKDNENTNTAFTKVDKLLVSYIKKHDVKENRILRESMVRYFKEKEFFIFSEFKENLFDNYIPVNKDIKYDKFLNALDKLGKSNKFDTTFTIIPEAIDSEIKCTYRVSNKITLVIDGELPKDAIKPITESSGLKFLKIKIDDDNTYKEFE